MIRVRTSQLAHRARHAVETDARRRFGFTLVELLIVLALMVLLAGIAWPALETRITVAQLPESATRFRDALILVRAEAAKQHRRVRIRFETGDQQPRIEIELDPILYPNEWEPVTAAWAEEAMASLLLSDVHVHSIEVGRPEFTKPISINDNPDGEEDDDEVSLTDDEVGALDSDEAADAVNAADAESAMDDGEYPIDEFRPLIQYEPDGTADWVLITLARKAPEEELEDDDDSRWVLLDGRSGLARVMMPLDEEEQLDPDNYVIRENLYLPDLSDLGRLSFKSTGFGGQPAVDEDGDGIPDDAGAGAGLDGGNGDGAGDSDGNGSSRDDEERPTKSDDSPSTTDSDITEKLDESDLSEQERETIRNALNGGGRRDQRGPRDVKRSGG